jgi:hypothetical protein
MRIAQIEKGAHAPGRSTRSETLEQQIEPPKH